MTIYPFRKKLTLVLCSLLILQTVSLFYISTTEITHKQQKALNDQRSIASDHTKPPTQPINNPETKDTAKAEEGKQIDSEEDPKPLAAVEADIDFLSNLDLATLIHERFEATESVISIDFNFNIPGVTIQQTSWHLPVTHPDYLIHLLISETAYAKRYDLILINPESQQLASMQLLTAPYQLNPHIGYINWLSNEEIVYMVSQSVIQGEMADSKYEFYILNLQTGLRDMPISPLEIKSHKLDSANVFGWTELEQEKRLVLNVYADGATFIVDLMRHEIIELNEKITNQYPIYHIFTAPGATGLVNFSEPDIWRLYNSRGELILTSERRTEANYHYPYANWHQSGSKFLTAYAYDVFELEDGHNFSVFALQGVDIYTHDGIHLINYEAPNDRFFEMVYWYDQELLIHEYSIYKAESDWYYQPIDSRYYLFNEQTGAKRELQAITDIAQINPSFKAVKTRGESYLSQGYMLSTRDNKLYLFTDEYENYLLFVELGEHQYYVRREDSSYFYLNLANSTKVEIDRDSKGQEHWDVEFYFMPKWRLDYTRSNERKSVYIKNYLNY